MNTVLKTPSKYLYKCQPSLKQPLIDFRSDTFTKPTREMLQFAIDAPVGDDVFNEDPTVNQLQSIMSQLCGKEQALYMVSGAMSNQVAIQSLLKTIPASVVCDKQAHVYKYEAGGISYHTGAHVIPIITNNGLTLDLIEKDIILDDDIHHAPTRLICMENSLNGTVI